MRPRSTHTRVIQPQQDVSKKEVAGTYSPNNLGRTACDDDVDDAEDFLWFLGLPVATVFDRTLRHSITNVWSTVVASRPLAFIFTRILGLLLPEYCFLKTSGTSFPFSLLLIDSKSIHSTLDHCLKQS